MEKCDKCGQEIRKTMDLTELRKVVMVYKMATGYERDDKQWDRTFFRIYLPTAKKLIEFMGSWEWAADCIQETIESLKDWNPECSITLQKILMNHAANWKKNKQEQEGRNGIRHVSSNGDQQVKFRAIS